MAYYTRVGDVPPKRHPASRPVRRAPPRGADGGGGLLVRLLAAGRRRGAPTGRGRLVSRIEIPEGSPFGVENLPPPAGSSCSATTCVTGPRSTRSWPRARAMARASLRGTPSGSRARTRPSCSTATRRRSPRPRRVRAGPGSGSAGSAAGSGPRRSPACRARNRFRHVLGGRLVGARPRRGRRRSVGTGRRRRARSP